jgi:acetyl-CoA carboxylase alpha subunit
MVNPEGYRTALNENGKKIYIPVLSLIDTQDISWF